MQTPKKLKNKNAVLNLQNKDDECLKWCLRAALFQTKFPNNPQRTSGYPTKDGIDYTGIVFPTPLSQISKLERQNPHLAINVFGWENDLVIVHRISKVKREVKRINLMLLDNKGKQHYCLVRRLTALLFDQTKNKNSKHFCTMCLTVSHQ